ncbi:HAD family hydrolase [Chromobacterium sp. IIBBL 290-4]|uniref:HAD family hydrolase n=1 Tax=Chromobacterium sp. IIBBL 290-4 TaxID=2953890 RepID=UPI0020B72426|nr:HAD family hydrolase [Chromobacterium sp. IIBBL 290-4]UTH74296.1 HAD family hydrolase [Chromobacterium sp. IIBBL 290-4]
MMSPSARHWFEGVQHIVFDWNGTLLDDIELAVEGVNLCCRRYRAPAVTRERYRRAFGFPIADFYADLGFDFDAAPFAEIVELYLSHFDRHAADCGLHEGVVELLEQARTAGLGLSILSASHQKALDAAVRAKNVSGYFDQIVGLKHKEAHGKLEEARALQAGLGVSPDRVLFIGDTLHDAEVAAALGWRPLLVSHGHQDELRLQAGGEALLPSLPRLF